MRVIAFLVTAVAVSALVGSLEAATKKNQSVVYRSAAGTVIQPTRTIIHNPDGNHHGDHRAAALLSRSGNGSTGRLWQPSRLCLPARWRPGPALLVYGPDQHGIGGLPLAQPWLIPASIRTIRSERVSAALNHIVAHSMLEVPMAQVGLLARPFDHRPSLRTHRTGSARSRAARPRIFSKKQPEAPE